MTSLTSHPRSKALLVMGAVGAGAAYARKRGERLVGRKDVYCVVVNRPADELEPEPGRFAQPTWLRTSRSSSSTVPARYT